MLHLIIKLLWGVKSIYTLIKIKYFVESNREFYISSATGNLLQWSNFLTNVEQSSVWQDPPGKVTGLGLQQGHLCVSPCLGQALILAWSVTTANDMCHSHRSSRETAKLCCMSLLSTDSLSCALPMWDT